MGAPGVALFCGNGHLFHWEDDDMFWGADEFERVDKAKEKGCPCGNKKVISVSHYGGINDCICLNSEIPEKGITYIGEEYIGLSLISDALNKEGNPIEAYTRCTLSKYMIPEDVKSGKCYEVR